MKKSTWKKAAQNLVCWKQQLHEGQIQRGEEKTGQGAAESAGSTIATAEVQTRESLGPQMERTQQRIPVWSSGKALSWYVEGPSFDPLRLSFLFKNCGLWTLCCELAHAMNETLKCLTQPPALEESFWW